MTPDRKKSGMAFWATVVGVVVLVGYPLSLGPACWLSANLRPSGDVFNVVYCPVLKLWDWGPDWLVDLIIQYANFSGTEPVVDHRGWRVCFSFE